MTLRHLEMPQVHPTAIQDNSSCQSRRLMQPGQELRDGLDRPSLLRSPDHHGAANEHRPCYSGQPSTISKLKAKFHITGDVRDRLRSGCPKKMKPQEDRFLTLSGLRYHRLSSTDLQSSSAGRHDRRLSAQTIRNRLHTANLRSHLAARRPAMTALHCQARLLWCQQHVHWNLNMWRNVMFSDEFRFYLQQLDHRVKVWRRRGERYADCCTDRLTSFGRGSVMVWGSISLTGKTRLVIIGGNLNAERYRDEIL
ncbi:hypothetical protein SRHO_G00220390 [Serrasalmus rhombeus]